MRTLPDFVDPALAARCRQVRHLTAELWESLPANFAGNCVVSGINADFVSIVAENAVWATRLRYFELQILRQFRRSGHVCRRLRLSVRPAVAPEPPPPQHARPAMSERTASALAALAAGEEDPRLAAALRRLSRRASAQPDRSER